MQKRQCCRARIARNRFEGVPGYDVMYQGRDKSVAQKDSVLSPDLILQWTVISFRSFSPRFTPLPRILPVPVLSPSCAPTGIPVPDFLRLFSSEAPSAVRNLRKVPGPSFPVEVLTFCSHSPQAAPRIFRAAVLSGTEFFPGL